MLTYKYKLYTTKNTKHLENILSEACFVWNHALAMQKRYYGLYHQYINVSRLKKYFAKHIHRTYLNSQSAQEILERLDSSYQRFFNHKSSRPPKFKKRKEFSSFVFKQCGFGLDGNTFRLNSVKKTYKFTLSRKYEGNVKQIRVKRSRLNEWYICVITDAESRRYGKSHNGASVGIDFGLKTYLTTSDGVKISNPQELKKSMNRLKTLSRKHSRCVHGSGHKERVRLSLCRCYEDVVNRRTDFQWKLAHRLCKEYDNIYLEDLNLEGMSRLWGRKMHDLGHGKFVEILSSVAVKYGCTVHKIDRYYPSSKLCTCGYKNDTLSLCDRQWVCPQCGQHHDRDVLAANNILRRGISELSSNGKTIAHPCEAVAFETRIP